ncbi:hypothetical protein LZ554_006330 [Drepanopeziza brunnea f. sp. 'monogermtubi']|nr:hypothetical protein LZ554_006330 [Drepanopeziza brunnea f. sp. 'monogermtubi']
MDPGDRDNDVDNEVTQHHGEQYYVAAFFGDYGIGDDWNNDENRPRKLDSDDIPSVACTNQWMLVPPPDGILGKAVEEADKEPPLPRPFQNAPRLSTPEYLFPGLYDQASHPVEDVPDSRTSPRRWITRLVVLLVLCVTEKEQTTPLGILLCSADVARRQTVTAALPPPRKGGAQTSRTSEPKIKQRIVRGMSASAGRKS